MYFSYNRTRNWLEIEWHDQSCIKLKVVAKNKDDKICLRVPINFLLFLRDNSPAYEISLEQVELTRRKPV